MKDLNYDVRIVPFDAGHNRVTVTTYDDKGFVCQDQHITRQFTEAEIAKAVAGMVRHQRVGKEILVRAVQSV